MASTDFISAERLRELLSYDPDTGEFTWAIARPKCIPGTQAGNSSHPRGYIQIRVDRRRYYAHRLAWLYMTGAWPAGEIDHINGIRSDNSFSNLRSVTRAENSQNLLRANTGSKVGLLGVSVRHQNPELFVAQIRIDGKPTCLGFFHSKEEAHEAYLSAKRKHHPFSTL